MFANNLMSVAERYCRENCPDDASGSPIRYIDSDVDENFDEPLPCTAKQFHNMTQASLPASGSSKCVVESPMITPGHTDNLGKDSVLTAATTSHLVKPEASLNACKNDPPPSIHITGGTVYFTSGRQDHSLSPVKASSPIPVNPSKKRKLELVEEMTEKMMSMVSKTFSAILDTEENTRAGACGKMSGLTSKRK